MSFHLISALNKLASKLTQVSSDTEQQLKSAVEAFSTGDMILAKKVIQSDKDIDIQEVELEEDCLKILALHQPVASDLRFIITVLKINNDLERIADHATNIADCAIELQSTPVPETPFDVIKMADISVKMVENSLAAFQEKSSDSALKVIQADTELNQLHRANYNRVGDMIIKYPDSVQSYFRYLSVSRYIERIGDLTKNIAEDIIYLIDGKIVRHGNYEG